MADFKEERKASNPITAAAPHMHGDTHTMPADELESSPLSSPHPEKRIEESGEVVGTKILPAFKSNAVGASMETEATQPQVKPWYKTPNPLRWGGVPPIPDERIVSPEYKAGFLSQLTFAWITPMMVVSLAPIQ